MPEVIIREIIEADLNNGFLESLDNLRKASNLEINLAKDILKKIILDKNQTNHKGINGPHLWQG